MKKNRFVEGTLFAYIMILITKVIGAIYIIPFRAIIGEEGGNLYGYAYQVYNLFLDISTSGIPTAISIIIAEYNALKMFNEREYAFKIANKLVMVISTIAFLLMFILAEPIAHFYLNGINETNIPSVVMVIRVISFCLLVIPFLSITRGYLQGNRYTKASSSSQLIEQVVRVVVALVGAYVAINVLHFNIPIGVSVALTGTVLGGLCAYLFLKFKIHRNKAQFMEGVSSAEDSTVGAKEVIKKIAFRAIPVIIIAATQNIYSIIDLKLVMQGLSQVGFSPTECETIGSVIVTYAPKICMIINSIAVGMCMSIIPFIVSSFVNKDIKELTNKFNQAMSTILFISIPLAVFIFQFGAPIYNIFYEARDYGGIILAANAITSVLFSLQMVMDMMLQGMKNYKLVFLNTITGLVINILLDIPIILLLNNLGLDPFIGTIIATAVGLIVSIGIILVGANIKYKINYKNTFKSLLQIVVASAVMILIIYGIKSFDIEYTSKLQSILILGIIGAISIGVYVLVTYAMGTMNLVFGEDVFKKIIDKFKKKKEA